MIAAFTFVPCYFGVDACVYTDNGVFLDRPDVYFQQLGDNHVLMICCIIYVFSVMIFNITGLSITRYINALARAMLIYGLLFASLFTFYGFEGVPRTIGLIQPLLLLIFVGASRAVARIWLGGLYLSQINKSKF